jgi:hypothetical protein
MPRSSHCAPSERTWSATSGARRSRWCGAEPLGRGQRLQAGHADPSTSAVAGLTVPAAVVSIGKNRVDSDAASSTAL